MIFLSLSSNTIEEFFVFHRSDIQATVLMVNKREINPFMFGKYVSPSNGYLSCNAGKYREFHVMYQEGRYEEAAALLVSLISSRLAPE